jgi:hypothetical protein
MSAALQDGRQNRHLKITEEGSVPVLSTNQDREKNWLSANQERAESNIDNSLSPYPHHHHHSSTSESY